MLTEDEFLKIVVDVAPVYYISKVQFDPCPMKEGNPLDAAINDYLCEKWLSAGERCDGTPPNLEPETELLYLDDILEKICPNITLLQYKRLARIIEIETCRADKYGYNWAEYKYKILQLSKLYDFLKTQKLL